MVAHIAINPFAWTMYFLFVAIVIAGAFVTDKMLGNRLLAVALAAGLGLGAGFMYVMQYCDAISWTWWEFCGLWRHSAEYGQHNIAPLDYALLIPEAVKWYLVPVYVASLVVRLRRSRARQQKTTNFSLHRMLARLVPRQHR